MDETKDKNSPTMLIAGVVVLGLLLLGGGYLVLRNNQNKQVAENSVKDKITLQLKWVPQAQFAGYFVAKNKGYYDAQNIDVEIQPGGVGIDPVDVLVNGGADVAVAWTGNVLPAIAKGEKLVNIGQGLQKSGMVLIAKKSSGILKPADIKGKRIGVWSGGNEVEPFAFIAQQGLDRNKDVTIVSQSFDMSQFLNDQIDVASAMTYNELQLVYEAGYKPSDLTIFDLDQSGAGMLQDALFVKQNYLDTHKDLLVRFMTATMQGWDYAITHQTEAVDLIGMDFTANDVTARDHQIKSMSEMAKLFTYGSGSTQGLFYIDRDKLQKTVNIAEQFVTEVSSGQPINLDSIYTMDIWNAAKQNVTFSDYSNI